MDPASIRNHKRGKPDNVNSRHQEVPTKLTTRMNRQLFRPDGDGYELVGVMENVIDVLEDVELAKQKMRLRGARKQIAARRYRPVESTKVVKVANPAPADVMEVNAKIVEVEQEMVEAATADLPKAEIKSRIERLQPTRDRLVKDKKIAELTAKAQEILGILVKRKEAQKKAAEAAEKKERMRQESMKALERIFKDRKTNRGTL